METENEISSWLGKPPVKQDADSLRSLPSGSDGGEPEFEMQQNSGKQIDRAQANPTATHTQVEKKMDSLAQIIAIGGSSIDSGLAEEHGEGEDNSSADTDQDADEIASSRDTFTFISRKNRPATKNAVSTGNSLPDVRIKRQPNLSVDIPRLERADKDDFEYLPGHFEVRKVLHALHGNKYLVKLASGETDLVRRLCFLSNLAG